MAERTPRLRRSSQIIFDFAEPKEKEGLSTNISGVVVDGDVAWTVSDEGRTFECFTRTKAGYVLPDDGSVPCKIDAFERLWCDQTKGLPIIEFNEVAREVLDRFKTSARPEMDPEETPPAALRTATGSKRPRMPMTLTFREYQNQVIRSWFQNNGVGVQMATGLGKTIAALGIAAVLSEKLGLQALVIICPYKHLVTQWARECARFGMDPLLAYESCTRWYDELTHHLSNLRRDSGNFLCVITTNATFSSEPFQQRIGYLPEKTLIVADEVHNLSAWRLSKALPDNVRLGLGLSATPKRWFDPEGTQRLTAYVGCILRLGETLAIAGEGGLAWEQITCRKRRRAALPAARAASAYWL